MSLEGQFLSLSLYTPSPNNPNTSPNTSPNSSNTSPNNPNTRPNSPQCHTPLHPVLEEVNGVIAWHNLLRQRWEPLFVNNLFLQSIFSGVHELYKKDKNALNGWIYGLIYQEIYNRPNIDIIKGNTEFYYSILSICNKK